MKKYRWDSRLPVHYEGMQDQELVSEDCDVVRIRAWQRDFEIGQTELVIEERDLMELSNLRLVEAVRKLRGNGNGQGLECFSGVLQPPDAGMGRRFNTPGFDITR